MLKTRIENLRALNSKLEALLKAYPKLLDNTDRFNRAGLMKDLQASKFLISFLDCIDLEEFNREVLTLLINSVSNSLEKSIVYMVLDDKFVEEKEKQNE